MLQIARRGDLILRGPDPSAERLFPMGWNIFLTNVSAGVWPPKALLWVYRLRSRIEIIFKAWKSHLRFIQFSKRNEPMVRLSVLTKLLLCIIVAKFSDTLSRMRACGTVPVRRLAGRQGSGCNLVRLKKIVLEFQ